MVAGLSIVPRRTPAWARRAAESLFAVLFPADCQICGAPLVRISRLPVCADCLDQILPVRGRLCSVCGERLLSPHFNSDSAGQSLCPVCSRIEQNFAKAVAYGSYESGLRELIHLLKYGGVRPASGVLGRMLAGAISDLHPSFGATPVMVVAVPLHRSKQRQRGFNHAELIARAALKLVTEGGAVRNQMILCDDVLVRRRETQSQTGLTSHQRRANMRGAFAVKRAQEVNGREVLLVDDVYTTGATVSECARVLRRAGASKVWVATVARTLKMASQYGERKPAMGVSSADMAATPLAKAAS
ncbi:MAG TPA: ComF family protein [Candidatus Sulfotelmatobacter sp.]|nr:ComF family protein [Candidatus Sulfotelmatobacter sp.]